MTVKREDNAAKPPIASTSFGASQYEKVSRKVFEKVIFSSAIEHYAHLARYLILQSPAGFRGVMHTKIMSVLKILAGQGKENSKILVKSKSNQKEVEIDKIKNDNEEEKKKTEKEDSNVINSSTSKSNATKLRNLKMEKEIVKYGMGEWAVIRYKSTAPDSGKIIPVLHSNNST